MFVDWLNISECWNEFEDCCKYYAECLNDLENCCIILWPSFTFNFYLFISEQIAHHSHLLTLIMFDVDIIYTFNLHSILQEIFLQTQKCREISTKLLHSEQLFWTRLSSLSYITEQSSHHSCNGYSIRIY